MNKNLSRRYFLKLIARTSVGLFLSACGLKDVDLSKPTQTPSLTLSPTSNPTSTNTPQPTETATPLPTNTSTPTATPKPPEILLEFAEALGIKFGGGTAIGYFQSWQPEYSKMVPFFLQNFNLFENGWDGLWVNPHEPLRPSEDKFDFSMMDKYADFLQKNRLRGRVNSLVWGTKANVPDWLLKGTFSENELLEILEKHIDTVVSRYRGKIQEYVAVNEILGTPWESGNRFWYDRLDKKLQWVRNCFLWAHEADPDALLLLNDFGIEFPGFYIYDPKRDEFVYNLIRTLKEEGVPIHGVGFQMHLNTVKNFVPFSNTPPLMDALYKQIQKYQTLGVEVYFTELDVGLSGLKMPTDERFNLQGQIYGSVLDTALSAEIKSITIFNLIDRLSWLETPENPPYSGKDADPCPWDDNYQPKPAYFAILDVMKKHYQQRIP